MTEFLFPDNTVLCNFAVVDRLDLLKSTLDGRGRWTEAVAYEATRSADMIPSLRTLAGAGWLGEAIEITNESDIQQINRVRRAVFGGTDDQPLKHLGEAQTCFVILEWREFAGSWWISDDNEALRYARFRGITTRETIDLVTMAVLGPPSGPNVNTLAWHASCSGVTTSVPSTAWSATSPACCANAKANT